MTKKELGINSVDNTPQNLEEVDLAKKKELDVKPVQNQNEESNEELINFRNDPATMNTVRSLDESFISTEKFHKTWKKRVEPATRTRENHQKLKDAQTILSQIEIKQGKMRILQQELPKTKSLMDFKDKLEKLEQGNKELTLMKKTMSDLVESSNIYDSRWETEEFYKVE